LPPGSGGTGSAASCREEGRRLTGTRQRPPARIWPRPRPRRTPFPAPCGHESAPCARDEAFPSSRAAGAVRVIPAQGESPTTSHDPLRGPRHTKALAPGFLLASYAAEIPG
jgi:hypothetical protein